MANDGDDATVEVQHFDGRLEEFELESWAEQEFEEAHAPEDWSGSVDVVAEDYQPRLGAVLGDREGNGNRIAFGSIPELACLVQFTQERDRVAGGTLQPA